ncbi:34027_t:CDS:1, partial [Gigaspora margarita]
GHEQNKYKNNKLIPYHHLLCKSSGDTLSFYQDTVIICLKNSLGFNRHSIGKKHITINAFSENVFLTLFENEENFKYMPSQRKYQCVLEGTRGKEKLKCIFKYDEIIFHEDINTSIRGYILFENNDSQYKITFSWIQKEHKENNRFFLTGTLLINFIANSGEFINK